MKRHRKVAHAVLAVLLALILGGCVYVTPAPPEEAPPAPVEEEAAKPEEYTFYFVSHIGPADPNMKWLTQSIDDAAKMLPVKVNYVAPERFSVEEQVDMLQTAIAAEPDGLIVPITDAAALEGPLKEAIEAGIPVIASNIPDGRPAPEKIPYLTYVGGDEYLTGVQMAERILQEFDEPPARVACGIGHVGHAGAEMRCQGLIDTMEPLGVTVEKVALTEEPAKISDVWRSYLEGNPDTEAIWIVTMLATPYVYDVTQDLGMGDQVVIATVDESPMSVEGILRGYLLATHSQQFYLQGFVPVAWLYINQAYGYVPPPEEIVGPVIIDETTAADWKARLVNLFGEETYNELAGWEGESPVPAAAAEAKPEEYTFYFVSHIGPADPNMKWLTQSTEDAAQVLPIKVNYVAPERFSVEEQADMLQTAIAAEPDGLIVPITDAAALEGPLKEAIEAGIPVIASNIPDGRPAPEKIPYLTYVGGDEYLTGVKMAERMLEEFEAEPPARVACGIGHVGHAGAEMRCQGLIDTMEPLGVTVEKVALTEEPAKISDVWRSYLEGNPDTEAIWIVTMLATPYVYDVTQDLGMGDQVVIATVDESPMAIEGILNDRLLATHSQQFYLQGYVPALWLYVNQAYGYVPPPEEIVGPVIIDETTAADWKERLVGLFGEETYNELAGW